MKLKYKNLLITGGAGFIGSNFIDFFLKKNTKTKIYNLDLLTYAGKTKNIIKFLNDKRYRFIEGDICDFNLVSNIFKRYKIDGVINFAAETHVDNSINNPDVFIHSNINGTFNLLNVAKSYWMDKPFSVKKNYSSARFHQVSTDEVYGSIEEGSFSELSNYAPNSPYSASKASADMLVRSFNKTYGLNVTTSICSNNYGPNQDTEKLIPKVINSLINNREILIYGDGKNIRDWLYVGDHCFAIDKIFHESEAGQTFNISGNFELTNLELVDIIYKEVSKKFNITKKIKFIKDRHGHDRRYSLNSSKFFNYFKIDFKNTKNKNTEKLNKFISDSIK